MNGPAQKTTLVSCSIFRQEIQHIGGQITDRCSLTFLDSMLHMHPHRLDTILQRVVQTAAQPLLLVYGDCCPHMAEWTNPPHVRKISGLNCCDIILGHDAYRRLRRERVFFFMPEWTARWEEVFRRELGLENRELAREFMHEMHDRLVYLDTGLTETPYETLADIEAFFDMPVTVMHPGLDQLKAAILNGLESLDAYA
jgi:hypothetical protein